MEKNNKKIILNCEKLESCFALLNNGRLEEYHIERREDIPQVGSIYLGRIVNLQSSLQAAFVDIGAEKNAFLHYSDLLDASERRNPGDDDVDIPQIVSQRRSGGKAVSPRAGELRAQEHNRRKKKLTVADIPELFKPGTELLVQVVKGPISSKGARVTTDVSIAGRYLVLMPYADHIGLSSRIESEPERTRLRKILEGLELPEGMGMICRTVGEGRKSVFFKHDLDLLLDYWHKLEKELETCRAPALLYREPGLVERTVRDFMTEEIDEIVVDDDVAYKFIHAQLKQFGGRKMASKVSLHRDPQPIFERFRVREQLDVVHRREVRLPSGGWICVDEAEALIAIDVNTGGGKRNADQPETIFRTNMEAAEEIARQLRLRNVGGLVVIDFIDMRSARDRDELFKNMRKLTKEDRAKTKVLPLSKLGLMEMTRQREHESLQDTVFNDCPYCNGTGRVKSALSMSVEIQRSLTALLKDKKYRTIAIRVIMHPEVLARLRNSDDELLRELEEKYHNTLSFRADPTLHYEEFHLLDAETGVELGK